MKGKPASMVKRVLLIDDDPLFIRALRATLTDQVDLRVVSVADDAVRITNEWRPNLILLDVHIAPGDSFLVLDELTKGCREQRSSVICLSRGAGSTTRIQRYGQTVFGTLNRTATRDQIAEAVLHALDCREMAVA